MRQRRWELASTRVLSPRAFVKLMKTNPSTVLSVRVLPPTLGRPGFGKIVVTTRAAAQKRTLQSA